MIAIALIVSTVHMYIIVYPLKRLPQTQTKSELESTFNRSGFNIINQNENGKAFWINYASCSELNGQMKNFANV